MSTDGVFDHKGYTEKALNKLIKAKAKADRAASRREAKDTAAAATPVPQPTSANGSTDPPETGTVTEPTSETPSREEQAETVQALPAKDQVLDRNELLRSKPEVVGRFMRLMVPVLIDVYAASVITSVRLKTLTGLLKAVGFLETEDLKPVFSVSELDRIPNQMSTKFNPSLFRLPVSLLQFYRRRTILPSFWELSNSLRYYSRRYQRSTLRHSGERAFSTRWRPWRVEH